MADRSQQALWAVGEQILGEYVIEKELGRGGMGRVWLVKSNSTGRRFAVKQALIRDDKHRKAFLTELQTWIDLPEHPNIVPCRFFRTVGDEIVIFAGYIEGGSLADWIANGKLTTVEQILDVAIQFAWGLHTIHERGIIHQDVKPGNVLMTPEGVPMVTDFGLARARMRAADGALVSPALSPGQQSVLVSSGGMTPAYASPEQRAGQPLSRKTDIWSWGVSVLDMLMGGVSCPHGGHIAADVLASLKEQGQLDERLPTVPPEFFSALEACFSRDPTERCGFSSLVDALSDVYQQHTGTPYPSQQRTEVTSDNEPHEIRKRIVSGRTRTPSQWLAYAYARNALPHADTDSQDTSGGIGSKGSAAHEYALMEEAAHAILAHTEPEKDADLLVLANFWGDYACTCDSVDDNEGALASIDKAIAIHERLQGRRLQFSPQWTKRFLDFHQVRAFAGVLRHKAVCVSRSSLKSAIPLLDRSITLLTTHPCSSISRGSYDDLEEVFCYLSAHKIKIEYLHNMGQKDHALALCDDCLSVAAAVLEQHRDYTFEISLEISELKAQRAALLRDGGDKTQAILHVDEALSTLDPLEQSADSPPDDRSLLDRSLTITWIEKALTHEDAGQLPEALAAYDRGIAVLRMMIQQGSADSNTRVNLARACVNAAVISDRMHDYTAAIPRFDDAIEVLEYLVHRDGVHALAYDLAVAYLNKANCLQCKGQLLDALPLVDSSINMLSNILSVSSASKAGRALATAYMNKGNTLWSLHRHQEATDAYRCFIETASVVSLEYVAERSRDVAAAHNRIGVCQMQNGDLEGALLSFEEQRRYDMTSGLADNNIACALLELHRNGEALTHAVSAVKANEKSSDAWDTLGLAHLRLNQLHKAEEALLKALTLDPQHRPALANLETVYNLMGLKDKAARCRRAMQ